MPVEVNENTIRIRQRDPSRFERGSFRTITLSEKEGIKAVIGRLIGQNVTTIQTYLFDKAQWSLADAKKWVRQHKAEHAKMTSEEHDNMVKLAATQAESDAQKARSRRYGISIRADGNVTKPGEWKDLPDSQWGDPVNYLYPVADVAHAKNAKSRFEANKGGYDAKSRGAVIARLNRLCRKYGLAPIGEKTQRPSSTKMTRLVGELQLADVEATEEQPVQHRVRIPAARPFSANHERYGQLDLDDDLFESFIDNWHSKVTGVDLAVDRHHKHEEGALAWIDDIQVEDGNLILYGPTTAVGVPLLGDAYKYASLDYDPNYVDPETGISYGPTLIGCAATNRPFVSGQQAITILSTDSETRIMDESQPDEEGAVDESVPDDVVQLAEQIEEFLTSQEIDDILQAGGDVPGNVGDLTISLDVGGETQVISTSVAIVETGMDAYILELSPNGRLYISGPMGNISAHAVDQNTFEIFDPDPETLIDPVTLNKIQQMSGIEVEALLDNLKAAGDWLAGKVVATSAEGAKILAKTLPAYLPGGASYISPVIAKAIATMMNFDIVSPPLLPKATLDFFNPTSATYTQLHPELFGKAPIPNIPMNKQPAFAVAQTAKAKMMTAITAAATAKANAAAVAVVAKALKMTSAQVTQYAKALNITITPATVAKAQSQLAAIQRAQKAGSGAYNPGRYIGGSVGAIQGGGWRM